MEDLTKKHDGLLGWFANNHVAANLLMLMIMVGGAISLFTNKIEIFPDTSLDIITVTVPYLGASPAEVEEGVCMRVEEAVAGIDGVKNLNSTASESYGAIMIEVEDYADIKEVLDDVKAEVDRIITFPKETEKPIISEISTRTQVISIVVFGEAPERTLKNIAEQMRDDLTAKDMISQIDVFGARNYEISIEVSEETLRRYGLSFDDVVNAVGNTSLDLPGGSVKTAGGEILIRTKGQKYTGPEFEKIVVLTRNDGTNILLGEIATVIDGFEDSDLVSRFDGKPAVTLQVYRVGEQNLLDLKKACVDYIQEQRQHLPEGLSVATWFDRSDYLKSRIDLLIRNGLFGLIMVFFSLALFLDLRLAFWTTLGIVISFLGAFWIMPYFDVSINMMSLYAFILALGLVVDDAIVVGENIFAYRQKGMDPLEAAVAGVKEIAMPVVMAVLTTVFAFTPLLYIYGIFGKFIRVLPIVVIAVLLFSLIESLLILPAHLSGGKKFTNKKSKLGPIGLMQRFIRIRLENFINNKFAPLVEKVVEFRYAIMAVGVFILLTAIGYTAGGHIKFTLLPSVDADNVWASLSMPQGTSIEETQKVVTRLEQAAERVQWGLDVERQKMFDAETAKLNDKEIAERGEMPSIFVHVSTTIGQQPFTRDSGAGPPKSSASGAHAAEVNIELLGGDIRGNLYASAMIAQKWRKEVGEVAGISSLTFTSSLFHGGDAINVEMSHKNFDTLMLAVKDVKKKLVEYTGVTDIKDTFDPGKLEVKLDLTAQGRTLGLTLSDLARQARQGFYGAEVQRIQRGRDDIRVMVRYPQEERKSIADIENMRIRLKDGTEIPFSVVADVSLGRGYANISRGERRRIVNVKADIDQATTNAGDINKDLIENYVPTLKAKYPGLLVDMEGEQKETKEIGKSLLISAALALLAIYGLLAVQFKSYTQPTIIMSAIPFGLVGAIIGHVIMGFYLTFMNYLALGEWVRVPFDLSILSIFGIVGLTGIVVNDSLIMVDLINRERSEGIEIHQVIRDSVTRRFRPIMLTTLTTFSGLVPMMLEKSLQARFLIPMAVSIAFGVLFATSITLLLVPSLYMILEDVKAAFGRACRAIMPGTSVETVE